MRDAEPPAIAAAPVRPFNAGRHCVLHVQRHSNQQSAASGLFASAEGGPPRAPLPRSQPRLPALKLRIKAACGEGEAAVAATASPPVTRGGAARQLLVGSLHADAPSSSRGLRPWEEQRTSASQLPAAAAAGSHRTQTAAAPPHQLQQEALSPRSAAVKLMRGPTQRGPPQSVGAACAGKEQRQTQLHYSRQQQKRQQQQQQVLLRRVFRAAASLALLLAQELQQIAAACLWQLVRETLSVFKNCCWRCSLGSQAAAAGLLRSVKRSRGRQAIALSSCASALQASCDFLKNAAASAAEAASRATAATQAARAAAEQTAHALCIKWKLTTARRPRPAACRAHPAATPPAHAGSLQLTPEEALATGKHWSPCSSQLLAAKLAWTCDLWASIHRGSPTRHVAVLQFQELLREHLMARDGSLFLLQEALPLASCQVTCGTQTPRKRPFRQPHQLVGPVVTAADRPRRPRGGAVRRTARFLVYACRLAAGCWGVLLFLFLLPFKQRGQEELQQTSSRKTDRKQMTTRLSGNAARSAISRLGGQSFVFVEVGEPAVTSLINDISVECHFASFMYLLREQIVFTRLLLRELRMECLVALTATTRFLKLSRKAAAFLFRCIVHAAQTTTAGLLTLSRPKEALAAGFAVTRSALGCTYTRSFQVFEDAA
ncbi:hypothetical protein Efla_006846 [Eimeria flavescens]